MSACWTRGSIMATAVVSSRKFPPRRERLVAGDDQRGALVAGGDEAEHQVGGLGVERDVADLVDDEQRDERQAAQLGVEAVVALGLREAGGPPGGRRPPHGASGDAGGGPG